MSFKKKLILVTHCYIWKEYLHQLALFYMLLYSLLSVLQHAVVSVIGLVCTMLTVSEQIVCGLCGFFKQVAALCAADTEHFFSSLHTSIHPTILPYFLFPAWLTVCVSRAYHWFSQDPWEKCHSAVQCEGLFGYQTSRTNLCGINLNICFLSSASWTKQQKERGKKGSPGYSLFKECDHTT